MSTDWRGIAMAFAQLKQPEDDKTKNYFKQRNKEIEKVVMSVPEGMEFNKSYPIPVEEDIYKQTESFPQAEEDKEYAHKGIASRSFAKSWQLGDDIEVKKVDYKDGLLTVHLEKFVPEEKQRKIWFSDKKGTLKGSK